MAVSALATELRSQGRRIIDLAAGEPDFDTPEHIRAAAIEAIRGGATRYTPVEGSAALKAAIIAKFRRENGLDYAPGQIIVSSGAKHSCFNLAMAVLGPGDEAIVPAPCWVSYPDMIRLADAGPVIVPTGIDAGFKLTARALQAAITPRTRLLFLNSPGNPTGVAYSRAEWQALGAVLEQHPHIVIGADDIYEHIYWGAEPFVSFAAACPTLHDRTVTINGVSKSYAMTGWRIGWAITNPELVALCGKIQEAIVSCPSAVSQAAAEAAVRGPQDAVEEMRLAYQRRRDLVREILGPAGLLPAIPEGAFYAMVDLRPAGIPSRDLSRMLLEEERVAAAPGSTFGDEAEGMVRISLATADDDLAEGCRRIIHFAERHGALPKVAEPAGVSV